MFFEAPTIEMAARNARIVLHIHEEMQMHLKVKLPSTIDENDTPPGTYHCLIATVL